MTKAWFERVASTRELTQGDLIFNCPVLTWAPGPVSLRGRREAEVLTTMVEAIGSDVVVMTQACDLEHNKVDNVVLCPHLPLTEYRQVWEAWMRSNGQTPTQKAWRSLCEDICDGYQWNLTIMNAGESGSLSTEHRIVDFHDVFTIPRNFLESLVRKRRQPSLRLRPPYREHLSQAFARYFMRVGLPVEITKTW